ncbi:uncharacterized protein LOC106712742 [Papilio machaon]|uniref:uncharacterized protein LOC106712742 n=1 Tax=Papilio machaon TaxID=76193 RepID=UPI001E665D00|nr:uncharacterized protein LOC106712742 [Papilio machaon]
MASNISLNKGIPVFRDLEYQSRVQENETEYPLWWSKKQIVESFQNCPEDTTWNIFICVLVLLSIVFLYSEFIPYYEVIDLSYNVVYAIHVLGIAYNLYVNRENTEITCCVIFAFFIDLVTYLHYFLTLPFYPKESKLAAYYLRLHRPIRYLWALNDFDFKSSIIGTALKNCYIFLVLRVTWTTIWIFFQEEVGDYRDLAWLRAHDQKQMTHEALSDRNVSLFFASLYLVNKIFIPIG